MARLLICLTKKRDLIWKKTLQNRIDLANKYIQFAIDNQIHAFDYFGGTYPVFMTFKKLITVSPTESVVTISWLDGYDNRNHSEKFKTKTQSGEEELKYTIACIIRGIKNGAKDEGVKLSHQGTELIIAY